MDVDEAPDAVPDAEVDELELEDETGRTETLLQVPPNQKMERVELF